MTFEACHLPERAVLSVSGAEAGTFLHNLLTCDVQGMGRIAYGALLTPQGKILSDLFVVKEDGRYLLDCAASHADELLKKLTLYRLRAKLALAREGLKVSASPGQGLADPRWPAMGFRQFGASAAAGDASSYHALRIAEGLADSDADLGSGELFPHEANLDQLNGVSFTKGCYVGQEVVSRMEHRGTARSRILPVRIDGCAPPRGTEIAADGKPVGTLLSSAGMRALAVIRLDRLQEALSAGAPLLAGSQTVSVATPGWARFHVPQRRPA